MGRGDAWIDWLVVDAEVADIFDAGFREMI
jgi:hypothetical protein